MYDKDTKLSNYDNVNLSKYDKVNLSKYDEDNEDNVIKDLINEFLLDAHNVLNENLKLRIVLYGACICQIVTAILITWWYITTPEIIAGIDIKETIIAAIGSLALFIFVKYASNLDIDNYE